MSAFAIVGARTFDGRRIRDGHAVVVEDWRIREVCAGDSLPAEIERRKVSGLLAPGFIDVQVNGGGGVLFNDDPSAEGIRAIGAAHRKFGTTGFLPTLITDTREKMAAAIAAVRDGLAAGVPGLLGIHLEGPFLSKAYKGAHNESFIRQMRDDDVGLVTSLQEGRTMVTISPEKGIVSLQQIASLVSAGVRVSIGHSKATYEEAKTALESGAVAFTHLFNAMPDLNKRAPGVVGAALDDRGSWLSVIPDLHHVSAPALRIAFRAKGVDRVMLITDAMSPTGTDVESFDLTGQRVYRRNGRLEFANGTLAGADLDMATAVRNTVEKLGVPLEDTLRMASAVPAEFLGLDGELGSIAPGYRANLVLLDDDLRVQCTWIDGREEMVQ